MAQLNEPSVWIAGKSKVKVALVNFLFIDILSGSDDGLDSEVSDLRVFIEDCARDNDFQSDVDRDENRECFQVQECIDDLMGLILDTAKKMKLKSIYRDNKELWTDCNINSDLITRVLSDKNLIKDIDFKKFVGATDDQDLTQGWTGDCEIRFIIDSERFIITIAHGELESDIIDLDNGCSLGYINEFLDTQNGSVHHCCVVALCWLTNKIFESRLEQKNS